MAKQRKGWMIRIFITNTLPVILTTNRKYFKFGNKHTYNAHWNYIRVNIRFNVATLKISG